MLMSPIGRARLLRLTRTFREVHASTGSLSQSLVHSARFLVKKLIPLTRYACATFARLFVVMRLRRAKRRLPPGRPVLAIRILGGIGDYIVIARFLRDLCTAVEPATFDIYSNKPRLANWIFGTLPGFRRSFDEALFAPAKQVYTVAAQISQFVLIEDNWILPGGLRPFPRLRRTVKTIQEFNPSIAPIIAEHPRLDSFLAQKAIFANRHRNDFLHYAAGLNYAGDTLNLTTSDDVKFACELQLRDYVTVHNGYDPNMVVTGERATKCYPHFGQVINILRSRYPDLVFVQVGIHTSIRVDEANVNLIGRTSLPEVAALIAGAVLHIDNEGGLVHLARAVGTKSCVVFGPTSSRYFGYASNINVDPAFCGGCWWINETWMNHCPRGFASARCMTEQPAAAVAEGADRLLRSVLLPEPRADGVGRSIRQPGVYLSTSEAAG
jgi:Glycosyltransferase family 9 (heptosyltransferase)